MITFRVVEEQYGWAVRMDDCMTTPFRSRELAIREAECLVRELRAHGQTAVIQVEEVALEAASLAHTTSVRAGVLVSAS